MTASTSTTIEQVVAVEPLDDVPIERRTWEIDECDTMYESIEMKTAIGNDRKHSLSRKGPIIFKGIGVFLIVVIMGLLIRDTLKIQYLEQQVLFRNRRYNELNFVSLSDISLSFT